MYKSVFTHPKDIFSYESEHISVFFVFLQPKEPIKDVFRTYSDLCKRDSKKSAKVFDIIIDMLIAMLYNYDIYIEPFSEYTNYTLTEIWIRPTITYGLVACFVTEVEKK